jgi:hypothetical protein
MAKPTGECGDEIASVPTRSPAPETSTTRLASPSLTPLPFEAPPLPEGASEPPPPRARRPDANVGRYASLATGRFAHAARK